MLVKTSDSALTEPLNDLSFRHVSYLKLDYFSDLGFKDLVERMPSLATLNFSNPISPDQIRQFRVNCQYAY